MDSSDKYTGNYHSDLGAAPHGCLRLHGKGLIPCSKIREARALLTVNVSSAANREFTNSVLMTEMG